MNLSTPIEQAVALLFSTGNGLIKLASYVRPAGLSSATGVTSSTEIGATCNLLTSTYRVQKPTTTEPQVIFERILVRTSELTGISEPAADDFIEETISGIRRLVLSSIQAHVGGLWIFETRRIPGSDDYGDLTTAGITADHGDLTPATTFDEYGVLV